ncbi:PadR family transcriptional regulator [Agromyces sp. MMS24-JH15]|uniref:PadR family transcriptional regulator n=1 Tax=Agromyces sp. MMS24-JH15 TaxID=3243765 RepID=UPI0037492827
MTPPVFAHGSLRLYLLALLAEQPRHGYELIQALSDRFGGTYAPSAGTIYPRLSKLEEEGLVTKASDGRKTVYEITSTGRAELDRRRPELDAIEDDVDDSIRRLAEGVRSEVDSAMRTLRAELANAAREAKRSARATAEANSWTTSDASQPGSSTTGNAAGSAVAVQEADLVLTEFRQRLRTDLRAQPRRDRLTAETVALLRTRLDEVHAELLAALDE